MLVHFCGGPRILSKYTFSPKMKCRTVFVLASRIIYCMGGEAWIVLPMMVDPRVGRHHIAHSAIIRAAHSDPFSNEFLRFYLSFRICLACGCNNKSIKLLFALTCTKLFFQFINTHVPSKWGVVPSPGLVFHPSPPLLSTPSVFGRVAGCPLLSLSGTSICCRVWPSPRSVVLFADVAFC